MRGIYTTSKDVQEMRRLRNEGRTNFEIANLMNISYEMLKAGAPPEIARSMLNHSTASSIVIKTNLREWRHIFMERAVGAHGKPHPEIQKVMVDLLECFSEFMPEVFARQVVIV